MVNTQLDRLMQDSAELQIYAQRLEKKGMLDRKELILKKLDYLNGRIEKIQSSMFSRTITT